jgi:hypothetical protein
MTGCRFAPNPSPGHLDLKLTDPAASILRQALPRQPRPSTARQALLAVQWLRCRRSARPEAPLQPAPILCGLVPATFCGRRRRAMMPASVSASSKRITGRQS